MAPSNPIGSALRQAPVGAASSRTAAGSPQPPTTAGGPADGFEPAPAAPAGLPALRGPPDAGPQADLGVQAARAAVRVDASDVVDARTRAQGEARAARADAEALARKVFDAQGVPFEEGRKATRVERGSSGEVVRVEVAEKTPGGARCAVTDFQGGRAVRRTLSADAEGTSLSVESWGAAPAAAHAQLPSTHALLDRAGADPSVVVLQHRVQDAPGGVQVRDVTARAGTVAEVQRTFRTQEGTQGVHPALAGQLDGRQPVEVLEVDSRIRPHAAPEHGCQSVQFAQGNTRVSSYQEHTPDGQQLVKQWSIERQEQDSYLRQDFAEGSPDYTIVTRRRQAGNTLSEQSTSRYLDDQGRAVRLTASDVRTFGPEGAVQRQELHSTHDQGGRLQHRYTRDVSPRRDGLLMDEAAHALRTDSSGDEESSVTRAQTLLTPSAERLLSFQETLKGPYGVAVVTRDASGEHVTLNGLPVTDAHALTQVSTDQKKFQAPSRELAHLSLLRDVVTSGSARVVRLLYLSAMSPPKQGAVSGVMDALQRRMGGNAPLVRQYAPGVFAIGGALSAAASGAQLLVNDLPKREWGRAAVDAAFTQLGLSTTYQALRQLVDASYTAAKPSQLIEHLLGKDAVGLGATADGLATGLDHLGGLGNLALGTLGAINFVSGLKAHNPWETAEGAVYLAATPLVALAAGALKERGGTFLAIAIQLGAFGVNKLLSHFDHSSHAIAKVEV